MRTLAMMAAIVGAALICALPARADPNRLFGDSRLVTLDRISVEVVGQGPDVVFIPGLASSRSVWRATAERLRAHYRLHLVQVAGFAGEPARANATGPVVVPTAEAIDAYLVQAKLAPAVVVGHSLGGTMALWLAEHHPEHLKKALVVDALPLYGLVLLARPSATPEQLQQLAQIAKVSTLAAADYAAVMQPIVAGMVSTPADRQTVLQWSLDSDRGVVANALSEDIVLDLGPGLGAIRTPITLLYPDYGPAGAPLAAIEATYRGAYASAPTIKLVRIDHSLHFIMDDQPAAFAAALDAFLASP